MNGSNAHIQMALYTQKGVYSTIDELLNADPRTDTLTIQQLVQEKTGILLNKSAIYNLTKKFRKEGSCAPRSSSSGKYKRKVIRPPVQLSQAPMSVPTPTESRPMPLKEFIQMFKLLITDWEESQARLVKLEAATVRLRELERALDQWKKIAGSLNEEKDSRV